MSDHADNADSKIYQTISAGVAAARSAPALLADYRCHFCEEEVQSELLFCNSDCRDDYERLNQAIRRNGNS